MKYENIVKGTFISRPNRFIAEVSVNGRVERAHVKNTGRCKELLVPGVEIYLQDFGEAHETRKTRYDLIGVLKGNMMINMDSQVPNKVAEEAFYQDKIELQGMGKLTTVKREKTYGNSRFDFYLEDEEGNKAWLEVKGVTLEEKGVVKFPDAPTERGIKHLNELVEAVNEGYRGFILFVIQIDNVREFRPNDETHKAFGDALRRAAAAGVSVLAYNCDVKEDELNIKGKIPVVL